MNEGPNGAILLRWVALCSSGLALLCLDLVSSELSAQIPAAVVSRNVHVSSTASGMPHVEPHLAIDPRDSNTMIVAARVIGGADSVRLRVYITRDGGASWTPSALSDGDRAGDDPWIAFTPDGTAHLLALPGSIRSYSYAARVWGAPRHLPRGEQGSFDYPKMFVDATGGTRHGWTYIWTAYSTRLDGRPVGGAGLLRSADLGATFSPPIPVQIGGIDLQVGAGAVLPGGTVIVSLHELSTRGARLRSPRLWSARFRDGSILEGPFLVTEEFFADSPDLAVDASTGERRGHAYLSWSQLLPGGAGWNQYVARSEDGGRVWSTPQPVYAVTQPVPPYLPHHAMAAVDGNGVLGLTWQEPRPASAERCFVLVFSASHDGGRTFSQPVDVGEHAACNLTAANQIPLSPADPAMTVVRRFGDGGDYHGLVGLPGGGFQAVWADSRTATYQLWTARIDISH